jgi:hypothetical protein
LSLENLRFFQNLYGFFKIIEPLGRPSLAMQRAHESQSAKGPSKPSRIFKTLHARVESQGRWFRHCRNEMDPPHNFAMRQSDLPLSGDVHPREQASTRFLVENLKRGDGLRVLWSSHVLYGGQIDRNHPDRLCHRQSRQLRGKASSIRLERFDPTMHDGCAALYRAVD